MTVLVCLYCSCGLDPRGPYYRRIVAWEKPGRGVNDRSGSSLVLREVIPEVVACQECVTRLQNGVDVHQETLA